MPGTDSESDRRDAMRKQIVDTAVAAVLRMISESAVTYTPIERVYLQVAIAEKILKGLHMEAMALLYYEETPTEEY